MTKTFTIRRREMTWNGKPDGYTFDVMRDGTVYTPACSERRATEIADRLNADPSLAEG